MKKNRWIAIGILMAVVLSGCGDRRELTEIGMVGAVAYDTIEGQTNVWMDVLQQDAEKAQLVNGAGPGCQEAYEAANEKLDRQIYPSHIRVHLLGETYAKQGLWEMGDMVLRNQSFRSDAPMLVVQEGTAGALLQSAAQQSGVESEKLYRLLHENAGLGRTVETTVLEFIKQTGTQGIHPLVGCVKAEQTETGAVEISSSGAAIFSEKRLLGYLDEKQTLICQLIRGTPVHASLYLDKSGTSVEIENGRTKKKTDGQKAEVFMTLYVSVTGKQNTMNTEAVLQETKEELQQAVLQTVHEVQQSYGIDIFGFGRELHGNTMDLAQWDRQFAQMPVKVQIKTILKSAGQKID